MAGRVLNELNALWVRMLKGLYFPDCSFLEARRDGRASWGWSNLITGRDMLKQEVLWTIGTGEEI